MVRPEHERSDDGDAGQLKNSGNSAGCAPRVHARRHPLMKSFQFFRFSSTA
jgi:hypothetical protein